MELGWKAYAGLGLFWWAAGCVGPSEPAPPAVPVALPERWAGSPGSTGEHLARGWLAEFDDPALTEVVMAVLEGNRDLAAAAARLRAARALAVVGGAERWPWLSAGVEASRTDATSPQPPGERVQRDEFLAALSLSWEIDLWGRLADRSAAAGADYEAVVGDYRAARLSLAATAARLWFSLQEAKRREELARRSEETFARSLATVERRFERGIGAALDVRLSRTNVASAQAQAEARAQDARSLALALETLMGRYPDASLQSGAGLPRLDQPVPAGVPADLLLRRPDIAAAEARLRAAGWRLSEAEKAFLPSIRLTATGGQASSELSSLLDGASTLWTVAGGLSQPVFQGGRLRGQRDVAEARQAEALAAYEGTVLRALREVEEALSAEGFLAVQERVLADGAEEARLSSELAMDRYRRGLVDIITVLEAQRRAFNFEESLLLVQHARVQNRVTLYLALGGDYATAEADGGY